MLMKSTHGFTLNEIKTPWLLLYNYGYTNEIQSPDKNMATTLLL